MNATPSTFAGLFALGLCLSLACGADSGAADAGESCNAGETRCSGDAFQECSGGVFKDANICAGSTTCSESLGCVECAPENVRTCVGDVVHLCRDDGSVGESRETCEVGQCQDGSCGGNECTATGTELVYVVDDAYNLLSFDPSKLGPGGEPFALIGQLDCPAGVPLGLPIGEATPFSMSVDRNGTAWVLYNSGEIFHVSTANASCQPTTWTVGSGGFQLFGMGFVSDQPGSDAETLYIAGGDAMDLTGGNLGTINRINLQVATVGPLPVAEQSPELTGTGDAKLYGYFPGMTTTFVANLDKTDSTRGQSWDTTTLEGGASAWAFAHWGGRFYIFATSGIFTPVNAVYELDPVTGNTTTVIANSAYRVVGAGVSTCAPTQID
jgi:hypothetical protein